MKSQVTGRIAIFLAFVAVVISFFFLTGAAKAPQIGKYQMECVVKGDYVDVYVMDTTDGTVKWYDLKHEGKPFEQIKVK